MAHITHHTVYTPLFTHDTRHIPHSTQGGTQGGSTRISSLLFLTYDPVSVFSSFRRGQVRMDVLSVYLVTPTITAVPPVPTESKTWAYL